jgi:putative FmdB family regulatory protein
MHQYDFRCKDCGERFTLTYKTYNDYDAATPACPNCSSTSLSRLITGVRIQQPERDYTRMDSGEMLNVLESGDSRQVGEMFSQIGGGSPELGVPYHEATQKLLQGQKIDKVERDLREQSQSSPTQKTSSDNT